MMNEQKITSLLGLAQKAGKIVSGELTVEKTIQSGKANLLIIATDCSENTKKKYRDTAAYYNIPLHEFLTKEELGRCIGKLHRAALIVVDQGFSNSIMKVFDNCK